VSTESTPVGIERALTLDILRGRYAAGSRLPTVRELAEQNGVTPATIQRVVARLETRGLVAARQGSGLRVNDPAAAGDLSLVPLWLEATLDDPGRAAGILGDFLEVRRVLAARLLTRHREAILARAVALHGAVARMAGAADEGTDALREADLAFARELLFATGNLVALGVLSTLARVLRELPLVAEAMYAEPAENAASMRDVLRALLEDREGAGAAIEAAIAAVDAGTLRRFEAAARRLAGAKTRRGRS
jgi:DNA-binding FadR family transcriptional regulator